VGQRNHPIATGERWPYVAIMLDLFSRSRHRHRALTMVCSGAQQARRVRYDRLDEPQEQLLGQRIQRELFALV